MQFILNGCIFYANHSVTFIITEQADDIFCKLCLTIFLRFPQQLEIYTPSIKACALLTISIINLTVLLSCRICNYIMIDFLFWKRVELIVPSLPEIKSNLVCLRFSLPVKFQFASLCNKYLKKLTFIN